MVKDARWPAMPLLALRGAQLFFSILVLGMSGYLLASIYGVAYFYWGYSMAVTSAVFTLVYVGINFILFYVNLLLPLAIVIVDAIFVVFWMAALGGLGATGQLPLSCTYSGYSYYYYSSTTYVSTPCRVVKAAFGISFLIFVSFIGTLVLASITLHKNRKDLRGAKYGSGLGPDGNPLPQAVAMGNVQGSPEGPPPNTYYQEPKQNYAPTSQAAPTPAFYGHQQHPVVSPPATPAPSAPYNPPQGYGMPQPPNAAEMPGR